MAEPSAVPPDASEAVGNVIRSFTDAELALRELLAAAATFRSAAEELGAGRDELHAARTALVQTAEGFVPLTAAVSLAATQLRDTAEALRAVDQQRIWDEFAATGAALIAAERAAAGRADAADAAVVAATDTVASRVATLETDLATAIAQATTLTATDIAAGVDTVSARGLAAVEGSTSTVTSRIEAAQAALEGATNGVAATVESSAAAIGGRVGEAQLALQASSSEAATDLGMRLDRLATRTDYVLAVAIVGAVLSAVAIVAGLLA